MNKRVIFLLSAATSAASEDDEVKSLQLAAEAVGELSLIVLDKVKVLPIKAAKTADSATKPVVHRRPNKRRRTKVQPETVALMWERYSNGEGATSLARAFGLGKSTVSNILTKEKKARGIPTREYVPRRKASA